MANRYRPKRRFEDENIEITVMLGLGRERVLISGERLTDVAARIAKWKALGYELIPEVKDYELIPEVKGVDTAAVAPVSVAADQGAVAISNAQGGVGGDEEGITAGDVAWGGMRLLAEVTFIAPVMDISGGITSAALCKSGMGCRRWKNVSLVGEAIQNDLDRTGYSASSGFKAAGKQAAFTLAGYGVGKYVLPSMIRSMPAFIADERGILNVTWFADVAEDLMSKGVSVTPNQFAQIGMERVARAIDDYPIKNTYRTNDGSIKKTIIFNLDSKEIKDKVVQQAFDDIKDETLEALQRMFPEETLGAEWRVTRYPAGASYDATHLHPDSNFATRLFTTDGKTTYIPRDPASHWPGVNLRASPQVSKPDESLLYLGTKADKLYSQHGLHISLPHQAPSMPADYARDVIGLTVHNGSF